MERQVIYFDKSGRDNTESCLRVAKSVISEGNVKDVVVASTTGETGVLFAQEFQGRGLNIVIVTHSHGFREPNTIEISDEMRQRIQSAGAQVYTGTMITHSLETALVGKFSGIYPTILVAQTLRRFGEGPKVCCEIAMMATDAGLIAEEGEVLTIAGTGRGADTVMIIRSASSKRFLDLKVLEILAKPRG
jgi:hypothetical protein